MRIAAEAIAISITLRERQKAERRCGCTGTTTTIHSAPYPNQFFQHGSKDTEQRMVGSKNNPQEIQQFPALKKKRVSLFMVFCVFL
jgi:hypothetical protein